MTTEEKQMLNLFETRVRQLIYKYKALDTEAQELRNTLAEHEATIAKLQEENAQWEKKYGDLKMAKMIDVSSQESDNAQKRITRLIREVDKCIALLNV